VHRGARHAILAVDGHDDGLAGRGPANHGARVRLDHVRIRGSYLRDNAVIEEDRVPADIVAPGG